MQTSVPAYVAERIRRPFPPGCHVVSGSTPVVAFGDARRAWAATLGLNPSRIEFEQGGVELTGRSRRFETLGSLRLRTLVDAPDEDVARIFSRCTSYFQGNPYRRWFDPLDRVLAAVGASYYDNSACHLDLTQWATDPTWQKLPPAARERLVEEDVPFLRRQLETEAPRLLLLNGRRVLSEFARVFDVALDHAGRVGDRSVVTQLYRARYRNLTIIGWSTNLQSSFGVTTSLRESIGRRVAELARSA